jgi:hypothetical protein
VYSLTRPFTLLSEIWKENDKVGISLQMHLSHLFSRIANILQECTQIIWEENSSYLRETMYVRGVHYRYFVLSGHRKTKQYRRVNNKVTNSILLGPLLVKLFQMYELEKMKK